MVSSRNQPRTHAALPGHVPWPQEYSLYARLFDDHSGTSATCQPAVQIAGCASPSATGKGGFIPMTAALPTLLQGFFHRWLPEQRNASRHTILAYRDAWRLFLRFVADRAGRPVAKLTLNHLTAAEVA